MSGTQTEASPTPSVHPGRWWGLLVLIVLFRIGGNAANRLFYPFLPLLQRGLGVSFEAMTQALSWRVVAPVVAVPLTLWVERRRPQWGLLLGVALFLLGYGGLGLWPSWPLFVLAVMAVLVGKVVSDAALQDWISRQVPYHRRGLPLAFIELAWSLSFFAGMPLLAWLFARGPWTLPFLALAGFITLTGLLLYGGLNRNHREEGSAPFRSGGGWRLHPADVRALWQRHGRYVKQGVLPGLWFGFACLVANEMVGLVFGDWLYRVHGLRVQGLGLAAMAIGVGELLGEVVAMTAADPLGKRRVVAAGLVLNTLVALALPYVGGWSVTAALVALALFFFTFEFALVSAIPLMSGVWPQHRALTMAAFAVALVWGRSAAAALTPWVYLPWGVLGSALTAALWNALALVGVWHLQEGESTPTERV